MITLGLPNQHKTEVHTLGLLTDSNEGRSKLYRKFAQITFTQLKYSSHRFIDNDTDTWTPDNRLLLELNALVLDYVKKTEPTLV